MSKIGTIKTTGDQPTFSVIIGCYNHRSFIQEAVNSVRAQSYKALQIIVVDDASPDDSLSLIQTLGPDIEIVASTENYGGSASRNRGADLARGDYLVFLDGDDALTRWTLEVYAALAVRYNPAIILASMFFFEGKTVSESTLFSQNHTATLYYDGFAENILFVEYPTLANKELKFRSSGSSMVFARAAFDRCGGWTSEIFPGEDTDIMLKMLTASPALHVLSPPTAYYRVHSSNTMKQIDRFITDLNKVIKRAKSGYYSRFGSTKADTYAFMGGEVFFWVKSALKAKKITLAGRLFLNGFPMIFAATARRARLRIVGRLRPQTLPPLAYNSRNADGRTAS